MNGTAHNMEEAAHIAASKWRELLFGWHLQDNGALDEETSFNMCALGTYLAESAKKDITEQAKKNAYDLFFEYYKRCKKYSTNHNGDYILSDIDKESYEWVKKNLPDPDDPDERWEEYVFSCSPYCDYGPNITLYRILLNAGIDKKISAVFVHGKQASAFVTMTMPYCIRHISILKNYNVTIMHR